MEFGRSKRPEASDVASIFDPTTPFHRFVILLRIGPAAYYRPHALAQTLPGKAVAKGSLVSPCRQTCRAT